MRARVTAIVLGVALAVTVVSAQDIRTVPRISIDEVKALMAKKQIILVDVRDPLSFSQGHIPGAMNVPFDFLPDHTDAWKKDKRLIVVYCA